MMKALAKEWLFRSGLTLHLMQRCRKPWVLMLHGIDADDLPLDAFQRLLSFCSTYFQPMPLAELLKRNGTQRSHELGPGKPAVALTFDDGLRNNALLAAPALIAHQIPATFYICPGQIDRTAWIWTYEVRARLASLEAQAARQLMLTCMPSCAGELEAFVTSLKKSAPAVLAMHLETVWRATADFMPSMRQREAFDLMPWEEVRRLNHPLFSIGSHTLTHQTLEAGTVTDFEREVGGACDRMVQEGLQRPADFCYPDGRYCAESVEVVRRYHRSAVTTRAAVFADGFDPILMPRIGAAASLGEMTWRLIRAARVSNQALPL